MHDKHNEMVYNSFKSRFFSFTRFEMIFMCWLC